MQLSSNSACEEKNLAKRMDNPLFVFFFISLRRSNAFFIQANPIYLGHYAIIDSQGLKLIKKDWKMPIQVDISEPCCLESSECLSYPKRTSHKRDTGSDFLKVARTE